jgi:hypothetical protein
MPPDCHDSGWGILFVVWCSAVSLALTGWVTSLLGGGIAIAAAQEHFGWREHWRVALAASTHA